MSRLNLAKPIDAKPSASKKWIILGVLVALLGVMGIRQFGGHPRSAAAAIPMTPVAANTSAKPTSTSLQIVPIKWSAKVTRDPFVATGVIPHKAPTEPKPQDQAKLAQNVADHLRADAEKKLHLGSTITGLHPAAVINGRVYSVGQTVEGFRVVEIHNRSVALEKAGVSVHLSLDDPLNEGGRSKSH